MVKRSLVSLIAAVAVTGLGMIGAGHAATFAELCDNCLPPVGFTPDFTPDASNGIEGDNLFVQTSGSVEGKKRSPFQGTGTPNADYTSVSPVGISTTVDDAYFQYDFSVARTTLDLLWGSPDLYNKVIFYIAGVAVNSISGGGSAVQPPDGQACDGITACNTFGTITALLFDSVRFYSNNTGSVNGQNAFEYVVGQVPVPPAIALFGGALAGMGSLFRRRRLKEGVALQY